MDAQKQFINDPLIGTVLPRRYRVVSLLGRGSMSVVYKGVYEPLNQPVAIKMLKSHLVSDPQQAKRFQQEIKLAGALDHPNIVGILDFGVTTQGVPYLVMEFFDGHSLSEVLEHEERLSVNRVIKIFTQACDALSYAHNAGVIHRDIKPSNLIVLNDGEETDLVKVVDFGIAKVIGEADSTIGHATSGLGLTATGEVLGTPLYMSPEQANGKELDGRSDIYALGCVLYHAITGRPPFVGDTPLDTIRMQITSIPQPIDRVRPDLYIPQGLQAVISRALQKDPRLRYQNMELLKADLQSCLPRKDSVVTPSLRMSREIEAPTFETVGDAGEKPNRIPVLAVAAAALLLLGVGVLAVSRGLGPERPRQASPLQHESSSGSGTTPVSSRKDTGATLASPVQQLRQSALESMSANNYAKADEQLTQALALAEKEDGNESPELAAVLHDLGAVKAKEHQFTAAEQLFDRALGVRRKCLGPEHPAVADTLCALGTLNFNIRKDASAETMFKNALIIRKKIYGTDSAETADVYERLANFYDAQNNHKQAEECRRALKPPARKS